MINDRHLIRYLIMFMAISMLLMAMPASSYAASDVNAGTHSYEDGDKVSYKGRNQSDCANFNVEGLGWNQGWCIEPGKPAKDSGKATVTKLKKNSLLRKVCWYYGVKKGLANDPDGYYWQAAQWHNGNAFQTMTQYANCGESALREAEQYVPPACTAKVKEDVDELKDKTADDLGIPDKFEAYECDPGDSNQPFVFWQMGPEDGKLFLKKVSARTAITDGNSCYSIVGARYTVYDSSGNPAGTLTVGSNGESETIELPEGKYTVKETFAPPGYALDTETYSVTVKSGETASFTAKDEPITDLIELMLTKTPAGYPHDHGEGDATLKGAVYEFRFYAGQYDTAAKAEASNTLKATWNLVTDANGKISGQNPSLASGMTSSAFYKDRDGKICYPLGTYVIREVRAPEGYLVNDAKLVCHVTEDGTDNLHVKTYNESVKGGDTIIRGGVKLAKIDNDLDEAYAQGDAALEGAEFTIYNQSAESVMAGGREAGKGEAALVITTNAEGIASSDAYALPYGTYLIKETKPSKGYLLNTEWAKEFTIREDGKIIDLTEDKVKEAVERGGVQIVKRDKELGKSEPLGGAKLDGIVMTIRNVSGHDVVVRKNFGDPEVKVEWKELGSRTDLVEDGTVLRVPTGKDVGKITVHWNEEKKAYTAETLADDLPYGTYTIRESKTNETYQRTDKTEHRFEIREDGVIVSFDDGQNEEVLTFDDYVYRSDVQGTKIADSSAERFSYVPFRITSVTNGETHVVVTDKNGFFSTKDRRSAGDLDEDEDADTARRQNPFDDLLEAKEIKTADLEKRSQDILLGVWFGTGEFGETAEMDSRYGALPYDSYILEEMPCEHNEGYTLQKFWFSVDQKSQTGSVDLETITDDAPEIGTTASVNGKNKDVRPQKKITLVDVIEYKGLRKGETYTARGVLMDKATGRPAKDKSGREITAEQEFRTILGSGKVKVTFTFDATSLFGKETVVFEKVFDAEGHLAAKHEEINDEGQTVTWEKPDPDYEMYKIRTTKAPSKGDKYGFFAQDEVEYEVHVENTGNIALTMDVTDQFTQNPDFFTVPKLKDVKFKGVGIWNNKGKDEHKANITLEPAGKAVVTYTAVVSDKAKEYLAAAAKDSDSLDEKGHDTNMAYQMNVPDDKDGYRNTATCENVTYPNPEEPDKPGKLEPKKDVAQTPVQKPVIGTYLANRKGDKTVAAARDTELIDTIAYNGLDTFRWYVFEGTMMMKDSGDPLAEHGKLVTVMSEPFRPARPDGTARITFIIDTTKIDGKELVAFENCYRLNEYRKGDDAAKADKTIVADHKDINDGNQTVKVSKTVKSVPPKTGDDTIFWFYVLLLTGSFGLVMALVAREAVKRHKEKQEDLDMFA